MDIFEGFFKIKSVKKALYFLISLGYTYYNVIHFKDVLNKEGYGGLFSEAINDIGELLKKESYDPARIIKLIDYDEPYLSYLYISANADIETIILAYLFRRFKVSEIFTVEETPVEADEKYKLVKIYSDSKANHEGIFWREKFYYYNPLLRERRDGRDTPPLIDMLFKLRDCNKNEISIRLDETISVLKEEYIPIYREFSELYYGKELNLDNIEFPLYKNSSEMLYVYNPKTLKKIQFKLTHRKDSEKWIEVEELWSNNQVAGKKEIMTNYIHSIYSLEENHFIHVDGSLNIYNEEDYKLRLIHGINSHATSHYKLWLTEGKISVTEWGKLVLRFLNDDELLLDAFKGNLIEEVFEGIT